MKEKLIIILVFVVVAAVLVGLNAASYSQKPSRKDAESAPLRSTLHTGPTGLHALYALLTETGRPLMRAQEPIDTILSNPKMVAETFVVAGPAKREFKSAETVKLLEWVAGGGRLVVIDRDPAKELLTTTADWALRSETETSLMTADAEPSDPVSMTGGVPAVRPAVPAPLSEGVHSAQASKFASSIEFYPGDDPAPASDEVSALDIAAPIVHLRSGNKNLLVEVPYGTGQIVFLTDPYMISNGGLGLADNARLGTNLLTARPGPIVIDEYHHGYGSEGNRLAEFFAGTPVIAIFIQFAVIATAFLYTRSRRFARPLDEPAAGRLSKLEYVSAMAELQSRTRAYDLAIENIYKDFRRSAARLLGADPASISRTAFAKKIAERAGVGGVDEIEQILAKCDEIVVGEPTGKRETLALITQIRQLEFRLGIRKEAA